MVLNFENLYHVFSIIITFLFSFYLLFFKVKERRGNIFIGLFILFIGTGNLDFLLSSSNFYSGHPNFAMILPATSFLFFPLMYFYIKSIAFKGFKLKWQHSIHLSVFLFFTISILFEYFLQPEEEKILRLTTEDGFASWFIPSTYVLLHLQALTYMILSIIDVIKYKRIVEENYSSLEKRNYKWILHLSFVYVFIILTGLMRNILRFFVYSKIDDILIYILAPLNILFLIWLIYKAMSQPYLFNGVDSNIKLFKELIRENESLKKEECAEKTTTNFDLLDNNFKLKLENYMIVNETYLNPSLTIFDLAKGLGLSSTELSVFLNKKLNKNFFDFVNEYRIKKAKEILQNPNKKHLTILEILYEVGFNSKSSFNTAFKKQTQQTPTQYRKNHLKIMA